MIRAVLDSNVLVSAAIRGESKPDMLARRWVGRFEWLTSEFILREVAEVLRRKKIRTKYASHVTPKKRHAFLAAIRAVASLVKVKTSTSVVTRDPKDNPIVACALDCKADYIVTGDHHLLDLKRIHGIEIVTTDQFLSRLEQE